MPAAPGPPPPPLPPPPHPPPLPPRSRQPPLPPLPLLRQLRRPRQPLLRRRWGWRCVRRRWPQSAPWQPWPPQAAHIGSSRRGGVDCTHPVDEVGWQEDRERMRSAGSGGCGPGPLGQQSRRPQLHMPTCWHTGAGQPAPLTQTYDNRTQPGFHPSAAAWHRSILPQGTLFLSPTHSPTHHVLTHPNPTPPTPQPGFHPPAAAAHRNRTGHTLLGNSAAGGGNRVIHALKIDELTAFIRLQ